MERWAERAKLKLNVDVLQSADAIEKGYGSAMVLEIDGQPLFGADAWLAMMQIAPWYLGWVGWLGQVPGIRQMMKLGYGIVARYRYRWFGTRSCPLPQPPSAD